MPHRPKICAIHQPNFFPWLGYFDKIRKADVFVFLDDVAYPKSGSGAGSWVNRVRIAIAGSPAWIGAPVKREHGVQKIKDVLIDDQQPWRKKLLRTLEINYGRAPNFEACMAIVTPLIRFETNRLADFNMHAITKICGVLGLETQFVRQSDLETHHAATELLVELTAKVGSDTYLCGGGADSYQDDRLFPAAGIGLHYQDFEPLPYGETRAFIPGLSVIDYLMKAEIPSLDRLATSKRP
jgi:hypothetical protein